MKYYLYKIVNTINCMVYVGQTQNIQRRFRQYYLSSLKSNKSSMPIIRAMRKHGIEKFKLIKIECFKSRALVNKEECRMIEYWRKKRLSYNVCDGGLGGSYKGHCGHKQKHLTNEWKQNISDGCTGIKHPWSAEAKIRNRGRGKGRKLSIETRERISKAVRFRWKKFGKVSFGRI